MNKQAVICLQTTLLVFFRVVKIFQHADAALRVRPETTAIKTQFPPNRSSANHFQLAAFEMIAIYHVAVPKKNDVRIRVDNIDSCESKFILRSRMYKIPPIIHTN